MIDDETDLLNKPGILAQLANVLGNVLTVRQSSIKYPETLPTSPPSSPPTPADISIAGRKNPRIRRWDSAGAIKLVSTKSDWIDLEDGVQIQFTDGKYQTGDYWLIPARTAKKDIEWPYLSPQPPEGIKHHYAKLAMAELDGNGTWKKMRDCRPIFPPLTELIALFYLSGDGQDQT